MIDSVEKFVKEIPYELFKSCVIKVIGDDSIFNISKTFEEMGIDDLDSIEILFGIEKESGVVIDDDV